MKQKYITYLAVTATIMCLCCCSGKNTPTNNEDLTWDSIICDTTAKLTDDIHSPMAEIHLNIKYADGKKASVINDSIITAGILTPNYWEIYSKDKKMDISQAASLFVNMYLKDYVNSYRPLYEKDKEHTASYNLQYSCNTHVEQQSSGTVCYIAEVYNYAGGAHGMNITIAKNFDTKTGKVLRLADVFVPGYEEPLKELITHAICERFDVKDLQALQQKSIFLGIEPYVPENFINRDEEVVFIYCDTEIAPHSIGEIRIPLNKKKLKDILKTS